MMREGGLGVVCHDRRRTGDFFRFVSRVLFKGQRLLGFALVPQAVMRLNVRNFFKLTSVLLPFITIFLIINT